MMNSTPSLQVKAAAEYELRARARRRAMQFRGSAAAIQTYRGHEFMLSGPAETGKTWATCWLLDTLLRETPKAQAALVRKVAADVGPTVLRTYQRVLAVSGSRAHPYGGEKPEWYDYPNGARLYIGGMDRPGKVLSGERDFVYVNQAEELQLNDWETLTTRTTGRGAVTATPLLFGDCNPGAASHWIINRPSLNVFYSKHEDNPTLYDDHGVLTPQGQRTMAVLDALTGIRKKRLRHGLWVNAEGAVYEFDRSVHLIKPFPIPATWPRYRAIDFGFMNPFVCLWAARDPDGRLYVYRQWYMSRWTVNKHAPVLTRYSAGESYVATVADHDAEDRATLKEHGIATVPAKKDISTGIQAVEDRLKVAGDGRPRLFVFEDSLIERDTELEAAHQPIDIVQEFESYVWPTGVSGKPQKETPVDAFNHAMDALRYLVKEVDTPQHRPPPRKGTISMKGRR